MDVCANMLGVHLEPILKRTFIEWKHLQDLYNRLSGMAVQSKGLSLVPKLKYEHTNLASYSRMRLN